jgi:hypothetical protein
LNKDEKPLWMYWVLLAGFISPTLFIAGVAVGSSAKIPSESAWVYISAIISAIATFIIALLTIVLAVETWRLRRTQDEQIDTNRKENIKPHVEIFLESSVVGFQFIIFKVENIGRGLARNVQFKIEHSEKEFSDSEKDIITTLEKLSFFRNSLSTLGVNGTKKSFLFSFTDMYDKYDAGFYETKLSFRISFEDMEGNSYSTYSIIDLSEFKGITEIGKGNPAYRTSIELEKIRKTLDSLIKSNKRIKVDSYSQKDRNIENEKSEARIREHLSKKDEKIL